MADKKLRDAVNHISANPALVQELVGLPPGQRKKKLQELGLGDYKPAEVRAQLQELLLQDADETVGAERVVEWVGAAATLAAGALAA